MRLIKAKDYGELSQAAANIIAAQITLKPESVLGLATGSTPLGAYKNLIEKNKNKDVDFSQITTVNLDEYCGLTPDNEQSYRRFMDNNLFNRVNVNKGKTNVPDGTAKDPAAESERYDKLIEELGGIDLQLLGLGHNGHIGFNEPAPEFVKPTHAVELAETTIDANMRFFKNRDEVPQKAITMGIGAIMNARKVLLIVSGKDKAEILEKVLYGPITPNVPASILQLHNDLIVISAVD